MAEKCENCGCKTVIEDIKNVEGEVLLCIMFFAQALILILGGMILVVGCWGSLNFGSIFGGALLATGIALDVYLISVVNEGVSLP